MLRPWHLNARVQHRATPTAAGVVSTERLQRMPLRDGRPPLSTCSARDIGRQATTSARTGAATETADRARPTHCDAAASRRSRIRRRHAAAVRLYVVIVMCEPGHERRQRNTHAQAFLPLEITPLRPEMAVSSSVIIWPTF